MTFSFMHKKRHPTQTKPASANKAAPMDIESTLDNAAAVDMLRTLADALEKKQPCDVAIAQSTIHLSDSLSVDVEYERDGDDNELELEFTWSTTQGEVSASHPSKFEIFTGKDDQFYFHLKAPNNKIILVSQGYASKQSAKKGIRSVMKNNNTECFEQRTSKAGQPYFVLKAANSEIIGVSQMYKREASCLKGMHSVINAAAHAQTSTLSPTA